ncbi:MAG TPA: hypothetical protein VHX60_02735 [Acidobacteriaceae bacterium]|jgi:hypothetical protein|nr:hypothetical protein [Acidobacteriaceae bacterium]
MPDKSFVEIAAEKVGYGLAMAEDLAGTVKSAIGSAAEVFGKSPAPTEAPPIPKKAAKKATQTAPAKKMAKKPAVRKSAAKKPAAKKPVPKKAAKKPVPKKAAKKPLPQKAAKKAANKAAKKSAGSRR